MSQRTNKELIVDTLKLVQGIATNPAWRAAGESAELAPTTLRQVEQALAAAEASEINPLAVTDYERDRESLERFWIFGILVAGKDSDWAAKKVGHLLRSKPEGESPLQYLKGLDEQHVLHNVLVANKVGQYTRIERALRESYDLDLRTATVEQLDGVFGVGLKTASFFVLHTRPGAKVAVLDTHVLKWLRNCGVEGVPDQSPANTKVYKQFEALALQMMKYHYPGLTPAEADLMIWANYSGRLDVDHGEPVLPGEAA